MAEYKEEMQVELPPDRRVRLLVTASNDRDRPRSEWIDLIYRTPPPPPRPVAPPPPPPPAPARPRLVVVGLGIDTFPDGGLPAVPLADLDAEGLAAFLADHLVAPDGSRPDSEPDPDGPDRQARLDPGDPRDPRPARRDGPQEGADTGRRSWRWWSPRTPSCSRGSDLPKIAAADTKLDNHAETTIPAEEPSDLLGQLTDYGCRVVLFLDAIHEGPLPKTVKGEIKTWVRDLQQNRRVITFVASKEGSGGVRCATVMACSRSPS